MSMDLRGELDGVETVPRFSPGGRRSLDASNVVVISFLFTLVGLVFTAGYEWRRVTDIAESQTVLSAKVQNEYVQKDVDEANRRTTDARLDEINARLAIIQRAQERLTR